MADHTVYLLHHSFHHQVLHLRTHSQTANLKIEREKHFTDMIPVCNVSTRITAFWEYPQPPHVYPHYRFIWDPFIPSQNKTKSKFVSKINILALCKKINTQHRKKKKSALPLPSYQPARALFQYLIRRLTIRSLKVSKPRDLYLELYDCSEIWQAHRQQCHNWKYQSRDSETSYDTTRRLIGYWSRALVSGIAKQRLYWPRFHGIMSQRCCP